jgi:GNAT superfamily N-acetyltransferase
VRTLEAPSAETGTSPSDRSEVLIRRVRPSDQQALERFYAGLSPESRRARFLGHQGALSGRLSRVFCTPDHVHAEGFVAVLPDAERGRGMVGHLCLEPAGERRIELALAVSDEHQGYGIGRALLEAAIDWACAHRMDAIVASAFADNSRVLRLLSSSPYPAQVKPADGGIVDVSIPLVPDLAASGLFVMPREGRSRRRPRVPRPVPTPDCRVVWRRKRPPAPAAAGSASRGSS